MNENELKPIVEHISNLIRGQIDSKNSLKGIQNIEVYSHFLRTHAFNFQSYLDDYHLHQKVSAPKEYTSYYNHLTALKDKLNKIEKGKAYVMPDLMQQYYSLKTAGISVGQANCVHLNKVMKSLAIENEVKQIRFWGKIIGINDYYVIQGISGRGYVNQLGASSEGYGVGINMYSYWVSTKVLGQWIELPLVSSEQVKGSRDFKYIFSGQLEKDIFISKSFQGRQKHLLKCVIARITHSCQIVPKGLYKLNQQNPNIIDFQDEFKCPELSEMLAPENWIHLNPNILLQGRASYYIDPKLSAEQIEALNTQLLEKDPMVDRLKSISEDKPYEALGYTTNWSVQQCGQSVPINQIGKQQGQTSIYGVVLLRNLSWPGASTVGYKGGWTSIYVGYGHRVSQVNTMVRQLKDIELEGEEKAQKGEPNPKQAPKVQKKQGQEAQIPNNEQIPAD